LFDLKKKENFTMFALSVPVYSVTLFLSAFLLFAVEPMFGKMVLPLLGGSPQVWNTAMVFFQAMLLAGYAYAHGTTRFLSVRTQSVLHVVLIAIAALALPVAIPAGWSPPQDSSNPAFWQLGLMGVALGAPFFVLAASAPLFQRWFSQTNHKHAENPYFLYAASNLGSMTALLSYPFVIEPFLTLTQQSQNWSFGYSGLFVLTLVAAIMAWKNTSKKIDGNRVTDQTRIDNKTRLLWLVLSLVPSSLMLGVTTYITTNLASVPLIWILPLALYVGTFILVFARSIKIPTKSLLLAHTVLLAVLLATFMNEALITHKLVLIGLHLTVFSVSALLCHDRLAKSAPAASHLTEFYLIMSLGGVLGGMLNALVAPIVFLLPLEYALALGAVCFLRPISMPQKFWSALKTDSWAVIGVVLLAGFGFVVVGQKAALIAFTAFTGLLFVYLNGNRAALSVAVAIFLVLYPGFNWLALGKLKTIDRNFFGVSRVYDFTGGTLRMYMHGTTNHGAQPLDPKYKLIPMTYFNPTGPLGDAFRLMDTKPFPQKIAVIGLGIGSMACYSHDGRSFDFFEIDPTVRRIAEDKSLFTYLSDCGSPYTITMGDGRLQMAQKQDQSYDMIIIDVFTSDNIPVHVMTREAYQTYFSKLKDDGVIVAHLSNNFLDLVPVVDSISDSLGMVSLFKIGLSQKIADDTIESAQSIYGVLAKNPNVLSALSADLAWTVYAGHAAKHPWTDDYASVTTAFWSKGKPTICKENGVIVHCPE
jgi:hypothetical protein